MEFASTWAVKFPSQALESTPIFRLIPLREIVDQTKTCTLYQVSSLRALFSNLFLINEERSRQSTFWFNTREKNEQKVSMIAK